jgi:nickel/cobalt transporter (NicO) family protein
LRAGNRTALALAAMTVVVSADPSAHRRDEYLQAARLAIDPDRVQIELDLTPGIEAADAVLADIDRDADRTISTAEARAYAARVVGAIALDVDGMPLAVELVDSTVPSIDAVRSGEGTLRIHGVAPVPRLTDGVHHLRYRNGYRADISVYLANALVPTSDRVAVGAQRRDAAQRDLLVDYTLRGGAVARVPRGWSMAVAGALVLLVNVWWRLRPREDVS